MKFVNTSNMSSSTKRAGVFLIQELTMFSERKGQSARILCKTLSGQHQ